MTRFCRLSSLGQFTGVTITGSNEDSHCGSQSHRNEPLRLIARVALLLSLSADWSCVNWSCPVDPVTCLDST